MGGDSLSVPILYEANATDFNNLGLGPLVDTTVATVTEERNGQFILEMQYPVDGIRASLIAKNRILKVDAGHKLKDQRFVIKRINRIMGNDGLSYSIYAEHISYITADYALKPSLTVNGSGNVAMTQWLNGIIDSNRIHVDSDITTENTTSWTIDKVQNARQALGGVQGSILDVWGGEYRFDNLNISLLKHRGTVSNTLLSYGRNITDFEQEENITNTYTSIYPFVSYSVQNGDASEQKILTIPDLVVDSEYVNNFPNRKIKVVDFSDKFSTDEKPTVERLAELAKSYIKSNNVGVPTVSTKISFVDLSKTENYKEFAPLEELDLCDEVPFAFEKFGIKTTAKISRIVWNVLLDSYDSLELGELKTNLSDVINNTNNAALDAKDAANDAKNSADNAALSANGKNRNWYGADDPAFGHLSELREGDSWYKPNGEDTELYHWINGQWVFILSTKDTHEAKDAADTAQKEAEEAKKTANESVAAANDAVAKAGFANDTATQAKNDAAEAGQQAKDAVTNALNAQSDASAAVIQASSAAADSKDAKQIAGAVSQSYKTLTDGSTMTIAELESGLAVKLTKTDLDGYSTQTWTQNQIKMTADGINGTMSSIKSTVDSQTTSINDLKADSSSFKSQFTTVNNTIGKQTTDISALQITSKELTTGFNTLTTDNGTNKNDISRLQQTASELNSTITTVQTQVQDSAVGVNLLRNTRTLDGWKVLGGSGGGKGLKFEDISLDGGQYGMAHITNNIDEQNSDAPYWPGEKLVLTAGQVYTISIWAHSLGTSEQPVSWSLWLNWDKDNSYQGVLITNTTAPNWTRYSATFTAGVGGQVNNVRIVPRFRAGAAANVGGSIYLIKPKLEKGSVATDFSVNPADNATVDAVSSISQNVDDMKFNISKKIEQKDLNGYATQSWSQGQLSIAKNEITTNVQNMTSDMATQTWTQGKLKLTADSLTSQISSVQDGLDTKYTRLEQTLSGVQVTANNAVTQSQYTQLADQFTTTIANVGAPNLVSMSNWSGVNATTHAYYTGNQPLYKIDNASTSAEKMARSSRFAIKANTTYTLSFFGFGTSNAKPINVYVLGRKNGETADFTTISLPIAMLQLPPGGDNFTFSGTFTTGAIDNAYVRVDNNGTTDSTGGSIYFTEVQLEEGSVATPYRVSDNQISSQFTQLQKDINLRVKAGDVVNQINISPESILIAGQKVHITGQTTIDNAVIKDAMIADIKADKITAGTLNAANVNVINLNANNITTGTIKGANLSLNLNTGEVVFQHGRIHSASNNIDINVDEGYLSTASNDTRVMLKDGQLQLVQPTIFDNSKDPYLQISNSIGGASFNGANIIARDYLVLANRANSDAFFDAPLDGPETFAGLAVGKTSADRWKPTRIGGAERGIIMRGGTAYKIDSSFMYKSSPEIFVGTNAAGLKPSDRIYINGSYVHIPSAYWRTNSGSANVIVSEDGALVRSTSASKYKTDIIRTNIPDYGEKLLELPTATWTDIAETKRYRDDPANQIKPTRNFGMIAEDLADAGLEMLVVRGTDGELEGINYDRIGPALIPVIAKLKNKIEKLEQKLEEPA